MFIEYAQQALKVIAMKNSGQLPNYSAASLPTLP